ncbi:MAG TPA: hypothetical protein VIB02_10995 [Candidatus Limnocylindrales bacterium]|jgi:hypothetical protein
MRFDSDRAIAAFLITGTALLVLEFAFPGLTRPIHPYFSWGGASIVGDGGWMAICVSLLVAGAVAWRR